MVAEIATRDRLQPSLLDRLTDDEPGTPQEAPDKRVLSLQQLKASVLRDLAWLLNTTSLLDTGATLNSPAGASVINYGLPALGVASYRPEIAHAMGVIVPVFTSYVGHKRFSFGASSACGPSPDDGQSSRSASTCN